MIAPLFLVVSIRDGFPAEAEGFDTPHDAVERSKELFLGNTPRVTNAVLVLIDGKWVLPKKEQP